MKVLVPIRHWEFTALSTAGIAVSNYPAWASATAYVAGDKVNRLNSEYEALAPSQGVDPSVPAESPVWLRLGAINRLKAFDETIYDQAVGDGSLEYVQYRITPPTTVTTIAFFNVNAREIRVAVLDPVTDETVDFQNVVLTDDANIQDWMDYFFEEPSFTTEAIIDDLVGYSGYDIRIRFYADPAAPARIGQIVLGKSTRIGTLCEGTSVGIQDYSRKERDDWGNPIIVERPFAQRVEYDIAVDTRSVREIQRVLSSVRARAAVYFDADQTEDFSTTVYGYFQDFSTVLTVGAISRMNLEVEGLV